jgi:DNA-binding winged helix-turn-helix (wHTH) protein/TolB-like protein
MRQSTQHHYEFGPFQLETTERRLLRDGQPVALTAKVFDILLLLVQNHGHLLEKKELMQAVWPDSFVEEGNLTRSISTLRKALGEGEGEYIETVPKRGYRFVADVREWAGAGAELFVQERISASVVIEEEAEADSQSVTPAEHALSQPRQLVRWTNRRRWLGIFAGALLIGLVAGTYWWQTSRTKNLSATVRSVAVLPFKPLKSDSSDEYLGLGLADTLITKLSSLRSLVVRPTSAVLKYSSPTQDPLAAGREQKVDAVLDASLQREGEHIRVTVRLLSVRDGTALWAYQCEELLCNNLFTMQDVISEQVAAALLPRLTGEERQRLRKRFTEDKEASQDYMKGLYFWNKRTQEDVKKGIEYFEQAIAKDPNYALAYVGLSDCYDVLAEYNWCEPKECFPKAKVAALKALGIDDELGEAHVSLAQVLYQFDWNWAEAGRAFKRAVELKPGYGYGRQCYGVYLMLLGHFAEAKTEIERALELDPVSLGNNVVHGDIFYLAREYDRAIANYKKILELDSNWSETHQRLGEAYERKGMYDQAIAEYLTALTMRRVSPAWIEGIKSAYAASGIKGYWQKSYRLVDGDFSPEKDLPERRGWAMYLRASAYARIGEKEGALYWLQQAYENRGKNLITLKVSPVFDGLRADPRFAELLRQVGLAP